MNSFELVVFALFVVMAVIFTVMENEVLALARRPDLWLAVCAVLFLTLDVWLAAIRQAQLKPHLITRSINGTVVSQFWVTNPAWVDWKYSYGVSSTGLVLHATPVTNYYWSVWPIFRK